MTRPVSTPMQTAAAGGVTRPCWLVEIVWATFSSRLSTYGTLAWNGQTWQGGGIEVGGFDQDGLPTTLDLADPDAAYRTLITGDGVRDRRVNVWLADAAALSAGDPLAVFAGYADGALIERGRVLVQLARSPAAMQFCPRQRIGPAIGVNFLAPAGTRITWGNSVLIIQAR